MAQPFTIYLMQSAHTDIGYTHPQEQIGWMYVEHYDRVLDLCARDEIAPASHRFKWTCETSWQVRNYLAARPERLAEFVHYARIGQIELTASFLHFTDMIDTEAYRYSLQWAVDFCRTHDLPLRCAMHCDINGWLWSMPDVLAEFDIPYFCSQVHIDSATDPLGKRGSVHYHWTLEMEDKLRPDAPIRVPQAFWWQGPRGSKTLHWLNEHYLMGNVLGLSGHQGFANDKSRYFWESDWTPVDELYALASETVPRYLKRLRENGYPLDSMLISTGGYYVDNSPPDDRWCEIAARWNSERDDIQLHTATLGEWFDHLNSLGTASLPTYQVAWPDGWAHGLGSMTARIAQERRVQRSRANAQTLVAEVELKAADDHMAAGREQELLALEHTFNSWMTSEHPSAAPVSFLQSVKETTFHRAELNYNEAITAALRSRVPPSSDLPSLYIMVDQADYPYRVVEFSSNDLKLDPEKHVLIGQDGQVCRFQRDSHTNDVPRFTTVVPVSGAGLTCYQLAETSDAANQSAPPAWSLRVDPTSGGLLSLIETAQAREWVDQAHPYRFGQVVHETVVHPAGRSAVGNDARMIALGVASDALRESWIDAPVFERVTPTISAAPRYEAGSMFDAVRLEGALGKFGHVDLTWRLYHTIPLVELVVDWDKNWNDKPEAAYVAFPFAQQKGRLTLETAGGFFQPGSHETGGQLPGTCSSYYTIQRAGQIQDGDGSSLLWLPLDAPLVMTQEINYNRWETHPYDWNGFLASMPVNHYWHTNFATSQRGALRLRYRLFNPQNAPNVETAIRAALPVEAFGWR